MKTLTTASSISMRGGNGLPDVLGSWAYQCHGGNQLPPSSTQMFLCFLCPNFLCPQNGYDCGAFKNSPLHVLTKMYRTSFWMKHFNTKTPKRTSLWSWSWGVSVFDLGKLKKNQMKSVIKTAVAYWDSKGRRRWKGTKALKATQILIGT